MLLTKKAAILFAAAALTLSGCTNRTGTSGQMRYFTEGTITGVETIDIDSSSYDTLKNTAIGAVVGAAAGQIIGRDTAGTLIGAGIGAIAGGGISMAANNVDQGLRLTVETSNGPVIIDYVYSCLLTEGASVRLINHDDGIQIQVYNGTGYVTAAPDNQCEFNPADSEVEVIETEWEEELDSGGPSQT